MHHLCVLIWCQVPILVSEGDSRGEGGSYDKWIQPWAGVYHLQVVIVSVVSSVTPPPYQTGW